MTSTTDASRHDLLGTAMTAAQVGAAIIWNMREDQDAPYVAQHLRGVDNAIAQLAQALAETIVASRMTREHEPYEDIVSQCEMYERRIRALLDV